MNESLDLRVSLGKLEAALQHRSAARSAEWASILNAIVLQMELPRPSYEVIATLAVALTAFISDAGLPRDGDAADALCHVMQLCRAGHSLVPPPAAPSADRGADADDEIIEPITLGPNAMQVASCLRFQLGMAVDGIYLFLSQQYKIEIPLPSLHRIILALPPPRPPSTRGSRRRR